MDDEVTGVLVVGGLILLLIVGQFVNRPKISKNGFKQKGYGVDFEKQTVNLGGKTYPASAIRYVRWHSHRNGGTVTIEVDDMRAPKREVRFSTAQAAEEFYSRFSLALEKAGAPFASNALVFTP